jgi:hypothetical protein
MHNEAVVTYYEILLGYSSGWTEEKHRNTQSEEAILRLSEFATSSMRNSRLQRLVTVVILFKLKFVFVCPCQHLGAYLFI